MKFNYFGDEQKHIGITSLGRAITHSLSKHFPRSSAWFGKQLLLKPYGKRGYSFNQIAPDREIRLNTSQGAVHVNLFGNSKSVVVVSHGWADNSESFQYIIKSIVKQGYTVAALDHIGHGKSFGNKSHLLGFIDATEILLEHLESERLDVKAIIAHSMGAVATLNLPPESLKNKKIILISLPIEFFQLMIDKVERVGISRHFLLKLVDTIASGYGSTWQQLETHRHKHKLNDNFTFIHDVEDRFAPYNDLTHFLEAQKPALHITQGLGHRRILSDTDVIRLITTTISSV